jgi:Fibronectin type III domain
VRFKLGFAATTILALAASLVVNVLPAAATSYPSSISTTGSTTRTDISDTQLATSSNYVAQEYAVPNLHNGFYYFGADPANASKIIIRSFKNGAVDTGFGGGTGQISFTAQLAPSSRSSIEMATYNNGANWMILESNWSANSGLNYMYLGSYASGYSSTITLPIGSEFYNNYCANKPSASFTQLGGQVSVLRNSPYSTPTLLLSCNAYVTSVAGGTSAYDYLVTVSGGTTVGTPGTYSFVSSTSLTPLADTTNKSVVRVGYSAWAAATGTQPKISFFYMKSTASSPPPNPSAYTTTAWSDRVITRISASGTVASTTSAWTGVSTGIYTGTLMVPPTNNGTIYAIAHATDTATSVMKVITFSATGAGSAGTTVTGATGATGPLGRAEIVAAATPGSLQKVACKDGGSGGYWEVEGTTAVSTPGGGFTSSGIGGADAFYWIPSEDSTGVSMFTRTSSTNIARLSFTTAPVVPSTPAAPTGSYGDGQVSLSWTAPSNGGATITDYEVDYSSDSGTTWNTFADGTSSATTATVTGLTNGTAYTFRIRAINSAGTSASSSASTAVTPKAVTSAPTSVTGTFGNAQVSLSWTAPSSINGSAITDYTIQYSSNGGTSWSTFSHAASTSTSATITGLTNGTSYTFKVAAVNAVGTSAYSTVSSAVVPATIPSTASAPTVTAGDTQVAVSWSAPNANGCSITDYVVEYSSDNGTTWTAFAHTTSSATSITVTGLTNNTAYKFHVAAVNCAGTATFSAASASATPNPVPSQTTGLTVATNGQSNQLVLTWTAPSGNGSAVSDYLIEYSTDGGTTWLTYADGTSSATTATLTGLTNGASYTFRVSAVNGIGAGSASTATTSVTAIALPGAIASAPTATASPGQIVLSWSAPSSNGGSAITDYLIQYSTNGGTSWQTWAHTASTATTATLTGLTTGSSYTFKISAINSLGTGTASTASTAAIAQAATAPSAVAQPTATLGSNPGEVVLSWSAPAANGSAITDYVVQYSTDGGNTWITFNDGTSTGTSATITGLTLGTNYQFKVTAVNSLGSSTASTSSSSTPVIAAPSTLASAPSVTSTPGQVVLTWSAPSSTGGSAITDYLIEYSTDGGTTWVTYADGTSTATSATLTGLTSNASYSFRVSAINAAGTATASTASTTVTAQASTAPSAITQVTATAGTNPGDVVLSWTAPAANGSAITDYVVQYSPDGGVTWLTFADGTSTSTTATLTGLTIGTTYSFRVTAVNSQGTGAASSSAPSLPVITVPNRLTYAPNAVASPGEVTVIWSAPTNTGGSGITDYLIEVTSNGGQTWVTYTHTPSAATSVTFTALTANSTYSFRVSPINAAGTGPVSTVAIPVVAQAATAPAAVGTPTATAGSNPGEVVLTWTAPAANGSAITDYVVEYSPDGGVTWLTFADGTSTGTTATVTGLTVGTAYVFRVTAVNGVGTAAAGTSSAPQAPASQPAPPAPPSTPAPSNNNSSSTPANPRLIPAQVSFGAQRSIPAGGPLVITGENLDMVLVVLIGNRSAYIASKTETSLEVAIPKNVYGEADLSLVFALGNIHFPRALHIAEPGPQKIVLGKFWKHKISQRSAATLLAVWPSTVGAKTVTCVAKYSGAVSRSLAMWRARRICASLQVARPSVKYVPAVSRAKSAQVFVLKIDY